MSTHDLLVYAFAAGIAYVYIRQAQRDLNGLGRKYRSILAMLNKWADTDEKKKQVSDLIEGK